MAMTLTTSADVRESHMRSRAAGIPPDRGLPRVGDPDYVGELMKESTEFTSIASAFVWELSRVLDERPGMVILTGADGVVVDCFSSDEGRSLVQETGMMVGVDLSEPSAGTNAVALALLQDACAQVSGPDHWLSALHSLSGVATPIHWPDGRIMGALALYTVGNRLVSGIASELVGVAKAIERQARKGAWRDTMNWLVMQEWQRFVEGRPSHGIVGGEIKESWWRCADRGLDPVSPLDGTPVEPLEIERRRQENALLVEVAGPLIDEMCRRVSDDGYAIALADADGVFLDLQTNMNESARRVFDLYLGGSCLESRIGTNGWGTSLELGRPVSVVGAEHYRNAAKEWASAGAPIRDPNGQIAGVLAVGAPYHSYHGFLLGLVISAADAIEKEWRLRQVKWRVEVLELISGLHGSLDLEATLDQIGSGALRLTDDLLCAVACRPPDDGPARESAAWVVERTLEGRERRTWHSCSIPWQATSEYPYRTLDRGEMSRIFSGDMVMRHGLRSGMLIPLSTRGTSQGGIVVAGARDRYPGELSEVLKIFGDQAAMALENALNHNRLGQAVYVDALTGLQNRVGLSKRFNREIETPYTVLFIDIDNFKLVNDTQGHAAGDEILKRVADRIRACSRQSDILSRYGGEEFVAVLPGTSKEVGIKVADRWRSAIADAFDGEVTVSIGVAHSDEGTGASLDARLCLADDRLYQAKKGGRNRVVPEI